MSDDSYDDDQMDDQPERESKDIRNLRRQAKEREAFEARALKAERELAFAKAGIDISDKKLSYFVKGYDGELTAEAIKVAAQEAGFLEAAPAPKSEVPAEELAQLEQVNAAHAGAVTDPKVDWLTQIQNAPDEKTVMEIAARAGLPTTWTLQ